MKQQPIHTNTTFENELITHLYQQHALTIFKYIEVSTRSREDAEDILVEIFLAALGSQKLQALGEKQQFAWLMALARNKVVDLHRRSTRRPSISLEYVADGLFDTAHEHSPEHAILRQEAHALLRGQIEQLPALQQEVLRLRFVADLRCPEIATVIGKTENAVRAVLSRAIRSLRTLYDKQ